MLRGHIKMSGGLQFYEETSRKVEALYLTPDVVAQWCQVLKAPHTGKIVIEVAADGPKLTQNPR
jgi:hypothetical protein